MPQAPHTELTQQQLENTLRLARISLDSAERAMRLQLDAAKQALEESAQSAAKLASVKDVQDALSLRAELTEQATGSLLGLSRNIYELASQTQQELARLAEEQVNGYQQSLMQGLDQLGKMTPAGSDVFSSAFKSSIAASQAAFDSLNKASRQVAEFADASLKAAGTATSDALKSSSRK
ncbi:phasin family protein [Chitinimonas taiwanensis]|jgi:phasin family protein|uniref:Phasin family protein n=1 Tax=Chitinimonas taiwanensis DSM 18899 TaxID=1121279 RepID=A0A1K2HE76_9NEIS|nr:phasin family protein [Chitinimonas taiwanensis]SFZ75086.1 phasin family protein [Chitinimonas taiwanensis DSM 18899]